MEELLGFKVTLWDYITFGVLFLCVAIGLVFIVWVAGLPGRIAIARKHPDAEAVKIMGYAGFIPVYPWMQAFIWAFKPTDIIDIRRFPAAEAKAIEEDIARLGGKPLPPSPPAPSSPPSPPAPMVPEVITSRPIADDENPT